MFDKKVLKTREECVEQEEWEVLLEGMKQPIMFVMDDELFSGVAYDLVEQYVRENPTEKFRTWLINKGLRIETDVKIQVY